MRRKRSRGPYKKYVDIYIYTDIYKQNLCVIIISVDTAELISVSIGKYACENGVARAAHYFSRKLEEHVSESTVHYIKKAYVEEDASDMDVLPLKKRGRPVLLGSKLDSKVKETQRKVMCQQGL